MSSDRPITSQKEMLQADGLFLKWWSSMTPSIFYWFKRVYFLLKITASVYAPIHFAHALHVHAKYFLDLQTIL